MHTFFLLFYIGKTATKHILKPLGWFYCYIHSTLSDINPIISTVHGCNFALQRLFYTNCFLLFYTFKKMRKLLQNIFSHLYDSSLTMRKLHFKTKNQLPVPYMGATLIYKRYFVYLFSPFFTLKQCAKIDNSL